MNLKQIFTAEETAELVNAKKEHKITMSDVELFARERLNSLYNAIVYRLYGHCKLDDVRNIDKNAIFYRDTINDIIELEKSTKQHGGNIYSIFQALKQEGYIGVCGTGYILEKPIQNITENNYKRLMTLMYEYDLIF